MTAARSNNGARIKERWKDAEIVGAKLGVTKFQAYNHLMTMIIEKGWLDAIKSGDVGAIQAVRQTDEWRRMESEPTLRVTNEEDLQRRRYETEDMANTPAEKLKCAMWLIRKVGSAEDAKIAVDLAAQAMAKLERRTYHSRRRS